MFIVTSWKKQGPQQWKVRLSFQAGPGNTVDEGSCSKAFTALQPLWVLVSKSIVCVCVTPLVLFLHPKVEKQHESSSWSWQSHWDGRWSSVLYNGTEHCKHFRQVAVFLLLGERDRYSLLPSVMVIAQPCLAGTCPGGSVSSTQPVITYNSKQSGDSMISLSTKQPSRGTATGVAT